MSVIPYTFPKTTPRSTNYTVTANGEPIDVHHTDVADFALLSADGAINIVVTATGKADVEDATIRPVSRGIPANASGNIVSFTLDSPQHVAVDIPGGKDLYIWVNPPESDKPDPATPGLHYFRAGQIHEIGELVMGPGENLYIEGGAVVRGCIRALDAENISIGGHGILDGCYYSGTAPHAERRRSVVAECCKGVTIEDLTIVRQSTWTVVVGNCDDVTIRNIKQIGIVVTSDGIDVVGSRRVRISGCFLRNNDDNIAIKSVSYHKRPHDSYRDWRANVDDVEITDCVFANDKGGSAMEIGFELQCDTVSNIVFRNIDVLHVHGYGQPFSINNGDRAVVENVLWEDIRIEHYYDKLIKFGIVDSRYSRDETRGHIQNVRLKNISVAKSPFNEGYSASLIFGHNREHLVKDVILEDIRLNGEPAKTADDLNLFTRNAEGVVIR